MRHLFDQYEQPENRLTHALACTLTEDRSLLRPFLLWAGAEDPPADARLAVVQQQVPGNPVSGDEAGGDDATDDARTGVPDASIYEPDGAWAFLVEAKIQARIDADQLRRHLRTARDRGYSDVGLLLLSIDRPPAGGLPAGASHRSWRDVYAWFRSRHDRSEWARRFTGYLETLEARMLQRGYGIRGTLTMFDGIRFDESRPYTWREARRLVRLLGDELQRRPELHEIGVDPDGSRRSAITGSDSDWVWDVLPLRSGRGAATFTEHPHLTMDIRSDGAVAAVTVPNGVKGGFRRRMKELGPEGLRERLREIESRTRSLRQRSPDARPSVYALQRHYPHRKADPVVDARLSVDLRTVVPGGEDGIKEQPEWVDAIHAVLARKRSNVQLGVQVEFPLHCPVLRSPAAVDLFTEALQAFAPMIELAEV